MERNFTDTWENVKQVLSNQFFNQEQLNWFAHSSIDYFSKEVVVIKAPSAEAKEFYEASMVKSIIAEAVKTDGYSPQITFVLDEKQAVVNTSSGTITGQQLNSHYIFDNFIIGPSNRLAHAAAMAVAEKPAEAYNPFFIHSEVGLGKTHLIQAVCYQLLKNNPDFKITYISCEDFMNEYMTAVQSHKLDQFRAFYRSADTLVVDDIHFLSNREQSQEEFFHTFNYLYNMGKQIILSSDSHPREIKNLEERLASRFKWGLVAQLDRPTFETRIKIIEVKAALRNAHFSDEVVAYIAEKIDTNIRELEGSIIKLLSYNTLLNREITLDLAKEILGEELVSQHVSIDDILKVISNEFRVSLADLQSKKRLKSLVFPRQIAMYLCRDLTNHSLQEIGGYFGGRDHTTVLHAEEKIKKLYKEDDKTKLKIEDVKIKLRQYKK